MSQLTNHLDSLYPEYNWWESDIDAFVDMLGSRGIDIGVDQTRYPSGRFTHSPAISFSGFSSQGDGLAFDCTIDWAVFCETHPRMAEEITEWWLLLSSNPDFVRGYTRRGRRNSNTMQFFMGYDDPYDEVQHGFFAGAPTEELPVVDDALDSWMTRALEDEADAMYRTLEKSYDDECAYLREQEIEAIKEEHEAALDAAMRALPDVTTPCEANDILGEFTDIDFTDLEELGLYVYFGRRYLKKEIVCTGTPELSGVREEEE